MSAALPLDLAVLAYTINLLIVATAVSAVSCALAWLVGRHNPTMRHFVCLCGISLLLVAPIAVIIAGRCGLGVVAYRFRSQPHAAATLHVLALRERGVVYLLRAGDSRQVHPTPPRHLLPLWCLFAMWGAGSTVAFARLVYGMRLSARFRGTSTDIDPQLLKQVTSDLNREQPLPPIRTSGSLRVPIAAGILRPLVILPEVLLRTLSHDQVRHILAHEVAHIRLRHSASGFMQRIVGVLYWPHPIVRALCASLSAAREEICDTVASQEVGAACYARTLLTVAEMVRFAPDLSSGLAFLGPGSSLEDRIAGLLDPRRKKVMTLEPTKVWAVTGLLAATILGAAGMRVTSGIKQTSDEIAAERSKYGVAEIQAAGSPETPIALETTSSEPSQMYRWSRPATHTWEPEKDDPARVASQNTPTDQRWDLLKANRNKPDTVLNPADKQARLADNLNAGKLDAQILGDEVKLVAARVPDGQNFEILANRIKLDRVDADQPLMLMSGGAVLRDDAVESTAEVLDDISIDGGIDLQSDSLLKNGSFVIDSYSPVQGSAYRMTASGNVRLSSGLANGDSVYFYTAGPQSPPGSKAYWQVAPTPTKGKP